MSDTRHIQQRRARALAIIDDEQDQNNFGERLWSVIDAIIKDRNNGRGGEYKYYTLESLCLNVASQIADELAQKETSTIPLTDERKASLVAAPKRI